MSSRLSYGVLAGSAVCAVVHAAGVLTATPWWRPAEVAFFALLMVYVFLAGLPTPRWAVPAALTVLLLDAVRTLPTTPTGYGWFAVVPEDGVDMTAGFTGGLRMLWAVLAAVGLMLVVRQPGARPGRRAVVVAAAAGAAIVGYAAVRVVDITVAAAGRSTSTGSPTTARLTTAMGLAALPAVALAVAACILAAVLAGRGRPAAAAGAVLLALTALPAIDTSLAGVRLPYSAGDTTALFTWYAITPTITYPQPVPALTAIVELTAFWLLFAFWRPSAG